MACIECGMATRDPGEFHPYAFCVWFRAGQDPWVTLKWVNARLGVDVSQWPEHPPLIRDIPNSEGFALSALGPPEAPDA